MNISVKLKVPAFLKQLILLKIIILTAFFLLTISSLSGQNNYVISGKITDSISHAAVPAVTVSFTTGNTDDSARSTITNADGLFAFTDLQKATGKINISCIGYQNKVLLIKENQFSKNRSFNLSAIYLAPTNKQLQGVIVTAAKPIIKQEIDRLSYDVQADPDSKSLSVLEMMSKVPMLSVDADENIKLKGSGNYRIFINGRPSSLMANNPRDALKAMPANTVQRIEVITTPPAKYDAEGLAGIINIVMNKKLTDGYTANVGANFNSAIGSGQNASLTAKKGKLGITGRVYIFQDIKRVSDTKTERQSFAPFPTFLLQQGRYSFVGNYSTESMELSYEPDSLNLFTASVNFYKSHYDDQTDKSSILYNGQKEIVQSYQSLNINPQQESGLDLDINYQKGCKHYKDRLLTFSYLYHSFPSKQNNDVLISQPLNFPQNSYRQYNKNGTDENTFQLDYVHPAKRFTMDGGIKAILRHNFSDFTGSAFDPIVSSYIPDNSLSNQFNYNQNVYSLYNSWQVKLKQFEVKGGVRLEHTTVDARFLFTNDSARQNYTNLIPVVSLQHKFSGGAINFGFTQRISRPGIYQLNPFVSRFSPQFISTGNPTLKAVLNNNFELAYSAYGKVNYNLSFSFSFANNSIQQVTTLVDTISYTTYQNIGKNKNAGLNASISYPVTKAFSFSFNSALTYLWLDGRYNGQRYTNKGIQGYAYTNFIYKISKTWRATASLTFVSANVLLQGNTNAYFFNSYRVYKDYFNKKFTVSVAVSNPYSKYRYVRTETNTKDFVQRVTTQRYYRMFAVSVNYNFGSLKSEIKKNQRSISNDDVSGKSK